MTQGRGYILVEGHGETGAVGNLIHRLSSDLELPFIHWAQPIRVPNLHLRKGIEKGCEAVRCMQDSTRLLILRDEDDGCPKTQGPRLAEWVADLRLPFPTAIVLFHREYEVLFLPCMHLMAGKKLRTRLGVERLGILPGTDFHGDPESIRGVKEWISKRLPPNRSYKPKLDQLPLTRMIDFPTLRHAEVPCFGTLERALRFLVDGSPGEVYPSPQRD